jgi:hypothetical protein
VKSILQLYVCINTLKREKFKDVKGVVSMACNTLRIKQKIEQHNNYKISVVEYYKYPILHV